MLNELVLYVVIYVYLLSIFVFILLLMKVIYNLIKKNKFVIDYKCIF